MATAKKAARTRAQNVERGKKAAATRLARMLAREQAAASQTSEAPVGQSVTGMRTRLLSLESDFVAEIVAVRVMLQALDRNDSAVVDTKKKILAAIRNSFPG